MLNERREAGPASGVPAFARIAPEDVPALMPIERLPGYDWLVGRWDATKHEAEMANPGTLYIALREGGRLAGFAIVLHLDDPDRRAHLKRTAVAEPGRGDGDGGRLLPDGSFRSLWLMSLLRREWLAAHGGG